MSLAQDNTPKMGIVISEDDPLKLGRVKLRIPGLFDLSDPNMLPWVKRGFSNNSNCYSGVLVGDKVMVTLDINNPLSFSYQPVSTPCPDLLDNLDDNKGADVLMFRQGQDGKQRTIGANDSQGIFFNNAGSTLNIDAEGTFKLENSNNFGIKIGADNQLTLGNPQETEQPAVLGDRLVDLLTNLKNGLSGVQSKCVQSQTLAIGLELAKVIETLNNDIQKILSSSVKITP